MLCRQSYAIDKTQCCAMQNVSELAGPVHSFLPRRQTVNEVLGVQGSVADTLTIDVVESSATSPLYEGSDACTCAVTVQKAASNDVTGHGILNY